MSLTTLNTNPTIANKNVHLLGNLQPVLHKGRLVGYIVTMNLQTVLLLNENGQNIGAVHKGNKTLFYRPGICTPDGIETKISWSEGNSYEIFDWRQFIDRSIMGDEGEIEHEIRIGTEPFDLSMYWSLYDRGRTRESSFSVGKIAYETLDDKKNNEL